MAITVHLLRILHFAHAMNLRNTLVVPRAHCPANGDDCSVVFFLLLGPIGEPMSGRAHTCECECTLKACAQGIADSRVAGEYFYSLTNQ